MNRCRVCVMPDTRPDTAFVDGVCAACIAYQRRPEIDWKKRRYFLIDLLQRARRQAELCGNDFDVIVPSSGGKDSTYQVITLLEHGARPLVVTASTCHLTPIGRRNIDNLKRYATTIEVSPQAKTRATLNRLGLEMVGDISWPEHVSIFTTPFKVAAMTGISFIFYGENPQNQYGGPLEELEAKTMTARWVSEFGGFLGLRPQDLIGQEGLSERDMSDYMPLSQTTTRGDEIEAHFLGQYIPWDSHRNANIARDCGMEQICPAEANIWAHENLDNAHTGIHDQGMYRKYGYGRGCAQASVDVRAGRMTREQALEFVQEHDGAFPMVYAGVHVQELCSRIGISTAALASALNRFTNWALFDAHPQLKRPIEAI